jgi:hypothetical protein
MKDSSNLDFKSNYPVSLGALTMSLGVLPMTLGWPHNYIPIQVQKLNRNVALRAPGAIMLKPIRGDSLFLFETCDFDISFRLHSDMSSPGRMLSNNVATTSHTSIKPRK